MRVDETWHNNLTSGIHMRFAWKGGAQLLAGTHRQDFFAFCQNRSVLDDPQTTQV
jgi:hypothetical protein